MIRTAVLLAAALVLASPSARAQSYPSRQITLIIPFTPGGSNDLVGRALGKKLSEAWGQTVVVENRGGGGTLIGAGAVAKAAPDGYTLLLHNIGQATSATLYRKLPYDVLSDFETIGLVTDVPMTLIGRAGLEPKTLGELLTLLKAEGPKINFGHAGVGSAAHLCGLLLMSAADVQMTSIPYQGSSQSLRDIVAGQIDIGCDQTTNTSSQIKSGQVAAFAVTTASRLKSLPDLPTANEAGIKGFEISVWHGLYAPKGTPEEKLHRLNEALMRALRDPRVIARFADLGTEPVSKERMSREVHRAFLNAEVGRWKPIIERADAFVD
jgi:tripartite-type tricarboxylate transporter receptor subunit TctC